LRGISRFPDDSVGGFFSFLSANNRMTSKLLLKVRHIVRHSVKPEYVEMLQKTKVFIYCDMTICCQLTLFDLCN